MKYIVTESQVKSLQPRIQKLIDSELDSLRTESEDWGMGEMDELAEVQSVDKIVVDRVVTISKIKVYVNIHKNSNRPDFDNLIAEIQYRLEDWIPSIELYIEDIIDDRKFGPGIDW
jgi:hypothetical protein